jgi:hypothetical protein
MLLRNVTWIGSQLYNSPALVVSLSNYPCECCETILCILIPPTLHLCILWFSKKCCFSQTTAVDTVYLFESVPMLTLENMKISENYIKPFIICLCTYLTAMLLPLFSPLDMQYATQ